jgi:competence protein ComEA
MRSQTLFFLSICSLLIALIIFQYTVEHSRHTSWSLKESEVVKERGWFAIKLNTDPVLYMNNFKSLRERFPLSCLPSIREGDLIHITFTKTKCVHRRLKLSARIRLALNIPLSINHDSLIDLTEIAGVGPSLATQLIKNRPWAKVSEMVRLRGIGQKRLQKMQALLTTHLPRFVWSKEE